MYFEHAGISGKFSNFNCRKYRQNVKLESNFLNGDVIKLYMGTIETQIAHNSFINQARLYELYIIRLNINVSHNHYNIKILSHFHIAQTA